MEKKLFIYFLPPLLSYNKNFNNYSNDKNDSMNRGRLTVLAMLSLEKQFTPDLPDFNEAVINKLANNRRMDFAFKQCNTV